MRPAKRKTEVLPASKASKVKKADDEPLIKASKAKNEKLPMKVSKAKKEGSDISKHTNDTALMISQLEIVVKENYALKELNKQKDEKIFELEKKLEMKAKGNSSKSVSPQSEDLVYQV
jgi:hypothetical protein